MKIPQALLDKFEIDPTTIAPETFSERMKRLRLARGMSMTQLAEVVGVHRSYIGNIESFRVTLDVRGALAQDIMKALGEKP